MRTVFNLISGVLLVAATAFSGYAQTSATPKQTKVTLDAFKTASGKAIGAEGGYNEGDMFLVKVQPGFYPEKYGAVGKTGSTSMTDTYFNSKYNSSTDGKLADFVLNKFAYSIWKLDCINTTRVETYRNSKNKKGKLYAYVHDVQDEEAPLSRFIFVERSSFAVSKAGSNDISKYNPFKYISAENSFLYNGTGYIEWSVSAADVEGSTSGAESTEHWVNAFNGQSSIENTLNTWTNASNYGHYGFSHDCSNAVMRNHYMYMQAPTGYSWQKPTTTNKKTYHYYWDTKNSNNNNTNGGSNGYNNGVKYYQANGQIVNSQTTSSWWGLSTTTYYARLIPNPGHNPTTITYTQNGQTKTLTLDPGPYSTSSFANNQAYQACVNQLTELFNNGGTITKVDFDTSCCDNHDSNNNNGPSNYDQPYKNITITDYESTTDFDYFRCNDATGTQNQTILLFVPEHSENKPSDWVGSGYTGPDWVNEAYRPYIQYFKAHLDGVHASEDNGYCYHNLSWFDNVNDKFEIADKIEEYEVEYKLPGDTDFKKYYVGSQFNVGNGKRTNERSCNGIMHKQETATYMVTYRIIAYIKGFGDKIRAISNEVELPVHGTNTGDIEIRVSSKSNAVDSNDGTCGTNYITHTITVTAPDLRHADGTFTISHMAADGSKASNQAYTVTLNQSDITWNTDGSTFTYTWTDANTYPYTGDGRGDDTYTVTFKSSDNTTNISSNTAIAPFYYAELTTEKVISEHRTTNEYYYVDQVNITAAENNSQTYVVKKWDATSNTWILVQEVKDSGLKAQVMESQTTSVNHAENTYAGYLKFGEDKGVWGIGIGDIAHLFPELAAGPLVVETFPHNQVLDVELGTLNEEAEDQTNYIWENPLIKGVHARAKATTPQIFPGADFKITVPRAKKPNVEGTGTETYYDVALALIIYDENGNRVTADGQEYFQSTVNGNAAPALIKKAGTENNYEFSFPQFSSRIAFTQENLVLTENVMFNFNEKDYTFDLFAIYLDDNKNAVAYRHTGYDQLYALETDAARNALYGTVAYAKNLPKVNSEKVIFETKVQTLQESSIKAKMLHEGGFAYLVLNMDEAIPTVDEKATVKEGSHTTDDLRNAITAYDVTVTQEGNDDMQVYTPKLAGAMTNGEFKADWNWDLNSLVPTADACKNIKFNGLIHDNSNASDKLTVYAEHTNDDSSITFVQELRNDVTGEDVDDIETTTIVNSSNQNFMLIGVSNVDIPAKAKKVLRKEGDEGTQGTTTSTNALDKNLKITVQPIYTVASLNTPILGGVMKFIGQYICYNRDDAKDNNRVNAVPSANDTPVEEDYSTAANPEASQPQNIEEEIETNYPAESVISGAEIVGCDESKVYAEGLTIIVEGEAELVVVFDASAKQVYAGNEHRIEVAQPGVYVVATGGKIYKVFVK